MSRKRAPMLARRVFQLTLVQACVYALLTE
jgi:hypothetical protein